jgi:hypothetical protein
VHVQNRRQISSGHPRKDADHAQHESLRPRYTDFAAHSFGRPLGRVDDSPQKAHELQDVW